MKNIHFIMVLITDMALVFVMSIFELWIGIPLGLFLDLNPILVAISAAAGSILSAFIIVVLGEGLRKKFLKWRYRGKSPNEGRIYDIWKKYGIVGLGLLSPLLFGAPLGAALGIGLGSPRNKLLVWMIIGIIIWSIFITVALSLGLILL